MSGFEDLAARRYYARLHGTLESHFGDITTEARLAYDGIRLWRIKAGIVADSPNEAHNGLPLTLRQAVHFPGLFRAEVSLPGIHESFFEYSPRGGFTVERSGQPISEVYTGQYVAMDTMVRHVRHDLELTEVAAHAITQAYEAEHPYAVLPREVSPLDLPMFPAIEEAA